MRLKSTIKILILAALLAVSISTSYLVAGTCYAIPTSCSNTYCVVTAPIVSCAAGSNWYRCIGYDASGTQTSYNYGVCTVNDPGGGGGGGGGGGCGGSCLPE